MPTPDHRYTAFLIGSLLTGYPDDESLQLRRQLLAAAELAETCAAIDPGAWAPLAAACAATTDPVETQADYVDLFDRSRERNSPYETEYGSNRMFRKPNELADLAGFYHAFGLKFNEGDTAREMPDHLAVELEFYALLLLKQRHLEAAGDQDGVSIVLQARRSFLTDHLGRFTGALADSPAVAAHSFFGPATRWVHALITAECAALGVTPEPVTLHSSQAEPDAVVCGACPAHTPAKAQE